MAYVIVNEEDEIIGVKKRDAIKQEDIYRVSALWITNSSGKILLAQRSFSKKNNPGQWTVAVAGTVEEGENYEENIYKEAEEELGITGFMFTPGPKLRTRGEHNYFVQFYSVVIDWPLERFVVAKDEVEAIRWYTREELALELQNNPSKFTSRMSRYMELFK